MRNYSFDDLKGKVGVITGGGGVIGAALAKAVASVGTKLAIVDVRKDLAEEAANQISTACGGEAIGVEASVLDKASLLKQFDVPWGIGGETSWRQIVEILCRQGGEALRSYDHRRGSLCLQDRYAVVNEYSSQMLLVRPYNEIIDEAYIVRLLLCRQPAGVHYN